MELETPLLASHQPTNIISRLMMTNNEDETQKRLIQDALILANKIGSLEKKILPSYVCRSDKMRLWEEVLCKNIYNGLKKIQLRWCSLQSAGVKLLANGIQHSCMNSLEILDLMGNEIGVSGARSVSALLAPGVDLDSFQVQDSRSVLREFEKQNIHKIGSIKTLILSHNCTSDAGCGYIGKAMSINNTLTTLELENCEIGDNGMLYLRRGVERTNTIQYMNIAANRFGELGCREVQSWLLRCSSLRKLDISRNRIGPKSTMEIAKGMIFI